MTNAELNKALENALTEIEALKNRVMKLEQPAATAQKIPSVKSIKYCWVNSLIL